MRKGLGFHNRHSPGVAALPPATNPPYQNVVMLLPGSGTNGAQNNTFLDSSTNAFAITRNGNTTQGTFSPYGPNWSNFFDGTGDYFTLPASTNLDMGSGDFTWEMWVFLSASQTSTVLLAQQAQDTTWQFSNNANELLFYDGTNRVIGTLSVGTWTHIAVVRSGTTLQGYINGTATGSSWTNSSATRFTMSSGFIGARWTAAQAFNGYISNLRIVKGTAVYTSNFTPPTAPLTNITNTSLLTCQSNRLIDNSSNAFAITRNGDVRVVRFSPFAPGAAYDPAVIGGSGYFDGAGDRLTLPASSTFNQLTNSVNINTIEMWIYPIAFTSPRGHLIGCWNGNGWAYDVETTGDIYISNNGGGPVISLSTKISIGSWQHLAFINDGTNIIIYLNGKSVASTTTLSPTSNPTTLTVGGRTDNQLVFNGYISNVRVVTGTVVYTSNFTPPTAPLTAITNTQLLLLTTNAGVIDNAMMNDMETVGNAQISNAQAKWGSTSISFDGTGDWLVMPNAPPQQLGTGNFTIEGWLRLNATGVAYGVISKGTATTGWSVNVTSGNKLQFSYTATQLTGATSLSSGQWYHFAVVRNGTGTGNLRIYLDGVVDATSAGAVTDNFNQTSVQYVGANRTGGDALNGYVQDARITRTAVYTAAFSPPTAAFPLF